jgi:predicted nucleic acid-binding Zn ribbon protein
MRPDQIRARALAEWRGMPETPFVPHNAKAVGDVLQKVMAGFGLKDRLKEEEVLRAWGDIAGEFIAKHSSPQRLKDGVLTVRVLQPTIHYELDRVWKRQLLDKLKQRFGTRTVRELKFRIG